VITSAVAASVFGVAGAAVAQDQQPADNERATETRPAPTAPDTATQEPTTQTVRRYEETTTVVGRGVTGDVPRPPANALSPEETEREQLWYGLSQPVPG
jgi:hypothetical protein